MMYVHHDSLMKLKQDLGSSFRRACRNEEVISTFAWIVIACYRCGRIGGRLRCSGMNGSGATWFVVAAACFFTWWRTDFIRHLWRRKLVALDDSRATPAERNDDGRDFVPTNKWCCLGTILRRLQGAGRWWGRRWRHNLVITGTLWLIAVRRLRDACRIL